MKAMLALRWTIGDVTERGFEALALSLWGAWHVFGASARYRVYVNTVSVAEARTRSGAVPAAIEWRAAHLELPGWLERSLERGLAEGVAWKFAPLRAFPHDHELALDNDVILWAEPAAVRSWLSGDAECILAEDVSRAYGIFDALCPPGRLNTGIRGLAPGFELGVALHRALARRDAPLRREVDEQGLQVAALTSSPPVAIVPLSDVTICSPFPPHAPELGACGAHFVGLNARSLGFEFYGRPAEEVRAEHWDGRVDELRRRVASAEVKVV
jgi:hypothetical protein